MNFITGFLTQNFYFEAFLDPFDPASIHDDFYGAAVTIGWHSQTLFSANPKMAWGLLSQTAVIIDIL